MINVCPECNDKLHPRAVSCACGWRAPKRKDAASTPAFDSTCCWNDHGKRCGHRGVISATTNGVGDWYCAEHYARLIGSKWPPEANTVSYREQWYRTQGKPYQAPTLGDAAPFRCIGQAAGEIKARKAA